MDSGSFDAVVVLEHSDPVFREISGRLYVGYRIYAVTLFGSDRIEAVLPDIVFVIVLVDRMIDIVESPRLELKELAVRPRGLNGDKRSVDVDLFRLS